jgi:hypothetical protein
MATSAALPSSCKVLVPYCRQAAANKHTAAQVIPPCSLLSLVNSQRQHAR